MRLCILFFIAVTVICGNQSLLSSAEEEAAKISLPEGSNGIAAK